MWQAEEGLGNCADVPASCGSVPLEEVRGHGRMFTPSCYIGAPPLEDDSEPFEGTMNRLVAQLQGQQAESSRLGEAVAAGLGTLGFGAD